MSPLIVDGHLYLLWAFYTAEALVALTFAVYACAVWQFAAEAIIGICWDLFSLLAKGYSLDRGELPKHCAEYDLKDERINNQVEVFEEPDQSHNRFRALEALVVDQKYHGRLEDVIIVVVAAP